MKDVPEPLRKIYSFASPEAVSFYFYILLFPIPLYSLWFRYSVRRLFTGLVSAALTERYPTVMVATTNVDRMASRKIPAPSGIRYLKSCRYTCMAHQAIGAAMTKAITSNLVNSLPNSQRIFV